MAISEEKDKREIIQRMLVTKQKAHTLEISLRFKGKNGEAETVNTEATKLSGQIDVLLGQVIDEWLGETEAIIQDIGKANTFLQEAIRKIQRDVGIAQNVVKAIGFIDDVVAIAVKIAGAF